MLTVPSNKKYASSALSPEITPNATDLDQNRVRRQIHDLHRLAQVLVYIHRAECPVVRHPLEKLEEVGRFLDCRYIAPGSFVRSDGQFLLQDLEVVV